MSPHRSGLASFLLAAPACVWIAACSDDGSDGPGEGDAADVADADTTDADGADAAPDDVADADTSPRYATEFTLVDIAPERPAPLQPAAHACAGLYNRELGGSVYTGQSGQEQTSETTDRDVPDAHTTIYELHAQYKGYGASLRALWTEAFIDEAGRLSRVVGAGRRARRPRRGALPPAGAPGKDRRRHALRSRSPAADLRPRVADRALRRARGRGVRRAR